MSAAATARSAMFTVARRVRAYFAPVDRFTAAPGFFDPARHGAFDPAVPPAPWLDLGDVQNFRRASNTAHALTRGGAIAAPRAQCRIQLDTRLEFDFLDWGKLQMALSGGSQHLNVLAPAPTGDPSPTGGGALPAIALPPGSTASELIVGAANINAFAVGDIVAADLDYAGQTGYIGTGIAAAFVRDPAAIGGDADYTRRVTFNVGRIASKTADSIALAQPLLGGAPASGAKIQRVVGFVDREGGSFFQEWSGLFMISEEAGGRIALYYPRLQTAAPAGESVPELSPPFSAVALHAVLLALPIIDSADGEQVLCYRSFFPAPGAALY